MLSALPVAATTKLPNNASVPGFGVQTVDRLLAARRVRRLRHADLARLQRRPRFRRYRAGVGGGATASADCTCPSSNTASASR